MKVSFFSLCKVAAISIGLILSGCAATNTILSKKELDVQTKTSTAIFIDPVAPAKRTVFVDVKSSVQEFDRAVFKKLLKDSFAVNDNNYRLVDDPEQAQFVLSAFVLNLENASPSASDQALNRGFEGGGVLAGAAIGGAARGDWKGAVAGGVVGAGVDMISGALVKDVTYMLVCDIQIKERTKNGGLVKRATDISTRVSDAGYTQQSIDETSNMKEYRTRIVTTANKANLKLEEAAPLIYSKTASAMSGFF
jgi:outer membrane lipoprotein SlyB